MARTAFGLILAMGVAACANPGIVQLSPDTYILSKEDHAGIFGSMAKLKADTISEANAFAAKQGKVAIPLSTKEKPIGIRPADWATFEYQFRIIDKDDPLAKGVVLTPRPDVAIESTSKVDVENKGAARDLYAEILKLDDLRKRGLITEAEFEAQKAKLLAE